jgi:hypothetical protein
MPIVVLTDIYAAGEIRFPASSKRWLRPSAADTASGRRGPTLTDVAPALARIARPGDLVITLGAGSIGRSRSRSSNCLAGRTTAGGREGRGSPVAISADKRFHRLMEAGAQPGRLRTISAPLVRAV